jgi:hypothetical protein
MRYVLFYTILILSVAISCNSSTNSYSSDYSESSGMYDSVGGEEVYSEGENCQDKCPKDCQHYFLSFSVFRYFRFINPNVNIIYF